MNNSDIQTRDLGAGMYKSSALGRIRQAATHLTFLGMSLGIKKGTFGSQSPTQALVGLVWFV